MHGGVWFQEMCKKKHFGRENVLAETPLISPPPAVLHAESVKHITARGSHGAIGGDEQALKKLRKVCRIDTSAELCEDWVVH